MKLVGTDFAIIMGALVWVSTIWWLWARGWFIHRNYMAGEQLRPMSRNAFVWTSAIIGAMTLIVSHQRPGAPGIIVVAMVGFASSYIDVRTHKLPNVFTVVMAWGALIGWLTAFVVDSSTFVERLTVSVIGALIWALPMIIVRVVGGQIGMGDLKLAPILGAVVGMVGIPAAVFSFLLTYISAGLSALWLLFTGSTSVRSRIPLGPWMVGSAIAGHILWGIIPDWVGSTPSLPGL